MDKNILLFIFDFIIIIPFTLFRCILIYLFGSKYGIKGLKFLDVIMHADHPYFNLNEESTVGTYKEDFRTIIRKDYTLAYEEVMELSNKNNQDKKENNNILFDNNKKNDNIFSNNLDDSDEYCGNNVVNSDIE